MCQKLFRDYLDKKKRIIRTAKGLFGLFCGQFKGLFGRFLANLRAGLGRCVACFCEHFMSHLALRVNVVIT